MTHVNKLPQRITPIMLQIHSNFVTNIVFLNFESFWVHSGLKHIYFSILYSIFRVQNCVLFRILRSILCPFFWFGIEIAQTVNLKVKLYFEITSKHSQFTKITFGPKLKWIQSNFSTWEQSKNLRNLWKIHNF